MSGARPAAAAGSAGILLGLVLSAAAPLAAQDPLELEQMRRELTRMKRDLMSLETREQDLIDLRIRRDLGLPIDDEPFALSGEERARSRGELQATLEGEQLQVAGLHRRFQSLRAEVGRLAGAREQRAPDPGISDLLGDGLPPAPGGTTPRRLQPTSRPHGSPDAEATAGAGTAPSADGPLAENPADGAGEPSGRGAASQPSGPPPVVVRAAREPSVVGRALFRAGDFARAAELLERAASRTAGEPPASGQLPDLFYLARCYEKLGRRTEARNLLLEIKAADSTEDEAGQTVYGMWARAADIAVRHLDWFDDHGGWQPAIPLDEIDWRPQK